MVPLDHGPSQGDLLQPAGHGAPSMLSIRNQTVRLFSPEGYPDQSFHKAETKELKSQKSGKDLIKGLSYNFT